MRGYLQVALAAALWGTLGLFFRVLHDEYQIPSLTLAFLRAGTAAAILLPILAFTRPEELRISRCSFPFYALYGLCGIAAFYFLYVQAVVQTTVTTAVILLYTAPAFVTLIAWRAWGEPMTARKITALAIAFAGCALVAQAYNPAALSLNAIGLGFGLGAGLTYALYTVFTKHILAQHSMWTALTYALLFGTFFLAPLQTPNAFAPLTQGLTPWILLLGLAIGPTLGSLAFYSAGLRGVPASNASIVAMLEPVVASGLSFVVLGERLGILQVVGAAMVIGGAVWLTLGRT
jgi:DME family drug/metabolite transporter